jgi:hypothetical protein
MQLQALILFIYTHGMVFITYVLKSDVNDIQHQCYPHCPCLCPLPLWKIWGKIFRPLFVWEMSSLFCNHICFVSTTESICEVHIDLVLFCVHVKLWCSQYAERVHSTVCFIAMCTILENVSQCHTCVTVFTERTEIYVCIFHCKSLCSTMCVHVQCSVVYSMLIGYLAILLLFVYFCWFFLYF